MRLSKSKTQINTFQKLRFFYPAKTSLLLKVGNCGFFFWGNMRFEFVYLKLMRRRFKIALKKNKKTSFNRKMWLNLKSNYPISKKPKNSRMGKGKGSFFRWSIKLKPMLCFIEFFGFHPLVLQRIMLKAMYWFTQKLNLYVKQRTYLSWSNTKKNVYKNTQLRLRII